MAIFRSPTPLIDLEHTLVPRAALSDQVYGVLKHRVLTCVLEPGKKLNERLLSDELSVSRTPLREALNRLSLEGLLELVPYKGYVITPVTLEQIRSLSELRRIVESEAAALAALRSTVAEQEQLLSLAELRYMPGSRDTYKEYLRANTAFHFALVRCSRNPNLEQVVVSVLDQLQRPLYLGLDVGIDAREATKEHLEVVKAICAKDTPRARKLMAEQIVHAEKRILAAVARMQEETSPDSGKMPATGRTLKGAV